MKDFYDIATDITLIHTQFIGHDHISIQRLVFKKWRRKDFLSAATPHTINYWVL
jgi:hypothetical protein